MPVTKRVPGHLPRFAQRAQHAVPAERPTLVDIKDVAEHLGVTVRHVRLLVAQRRIPFYKWGHLLRFDPDQVAGWVAEALVEPIVYEEHRSSRRGM